MKFVVQLAVFVFFFFQGSTANAEILLIQDKRVPSPVFRVNTETGEAFTMAKSNQGREQWERIFDVENLGKSEYQFVIRTTGSASDLLRINKLTGVSWLAKGKRWQRILEG